MASPNSVFQLPKDWRVYTEQILERCASLIQYRIWGDFHSSRLRRWMNNFTTDEERYFAACVLDSLIYRSKDQTLALIRQLFQRSLPDLTRLDPTPSGAIEDWQELLRTSQVSGDPGLRMVAVVKSSDPPGKSAQVIARYMMQDLSINKQWLINPWEMRRHAKAGCNIFVFTDDFLGTGDQFEEVVESERLPPLFASTYCVYAPLVAHVDGMHYLRSKYKELRLSPVEVLDDSYGLFHATSRAFEDQTNTPESAKDFYYELLKKKGIRIQGPERRGYGHLELAYAFEHATPDNNLPILWWQKNRWNPLFKHRP